GLDGKSVLLSDFRGNPLLMLFWNPDCGFCQQMLPDLKAWEVKLPPGVPRLLVVSTGTIEENLAMGLRSPVVLDEDFKVRSMFGATGTPMAVLIDAQGAITSELAAGTLAVLTLLAGSSQDAVQSVT